MNRSLIFPLVQIYFVLTSLILLITVAPLGDIAYIPRGVAHQAVALRSEGDGGALDDVSLHLTVGLETATHHTVEVSICTVNSYTFT